MQLVYLPLYHFDCYLSVSESQGWIFTTLGGIGTTMDKRRALNFVSDLEHILDIITFSSRSTTDINLRSHKISNDTTATTFVFKSRALTTLSKYVNW